MDSFNAENVDHVKSADAISEGNESVPKTTVCHKSAISASLHSSRSMLQDQTETTQITKTGSSNLGAVYVWPTLARMRKLVAGMLRWPTSRWMASARTQGV